MPKGITKYMYYLFIMNYSLFFKSKSTCTCLCISWSRLSPICNLKQDFTSLLPLKDLSLVADDTDSVSKLLMMLYIVGYKSRFAACRVSSSISGLSSTRDHLKTSSTKSWKISTCVYQSESGGLLYIKKKMVKLMYRHVPFWA